MYNPNHDIDSTPTDPIYGHICSPNTHAPVPSANVPPSLIFIPKPPLLSPPRLMHYTWPRFDPHWISTTLEEWEWVKWIWCDICIRFVGQYIHSYWRITIMYMNKSPFGGASSFDGACSGMGSNRRPLSVIDVSILFSTSMFKDVLFLWPLHSKTKTSFSTRMHHCCSKTSTLVYIVQIWGSEIPPFVVICITPLGTKHFEVFGLGSHLYKQYVYK